MTTTTLERTEGLSVLNQAMAAIKEKIEEKRGVFNIQMEVNDINPAPTRVEFNRHALRKFIMAPCLVTCVDTSATLKIRVVVVSFLPVF